jgi:dynein heavy chain
VQALERLCRDVQAQAVLYQESIRDASELEDTTGVELLQGRTGGHARPMVVIKQVSTKASHSIAPQQQ